MTSARPAGRKHHLRVVVTDGRGGRLPAHAGLGPWLVRHAPRAARGAVVIALVGDAQMQRLNRTFRGVDAPTDVLSFPAGPPPDRRGQSSATAPPLGELAIALGVARRQARAEGHNLATELRVLALHGLLHLLGYDHERDRGTMRRVEERLRRRAGLPAGLIARTPQAAARRSLHR